MRTRKNLLWISLIIVLVLCLFSADMKTSSAVESPAIMVVPKSTLDETLTIGKNFTVSITTDYNGSDVYSYQFTLSYNPDVLSIGANNTDLWTGAGMAQLTFNTTIKPVIENSEKVYVNDVLKTRDVEYLITYDQGLIWFFPFAAPPFGSEVKATYQYGVVNGDLITTDKSPNARFEAGSFNNTLGTLDLTMAWFFYTEKPVNITSGPGILANITFTVVGYGTSNITLGPETLLVGWTEGGMGEEYEIINAQYQPDHIQHGYFSNKIPGDVDGDHDVDFTDFWLFVGVYPSDPAGNPQADLDWDGDVDFTDFWMFVGHYPTP